MMGRDRATPEKIINSLKSWWIHHDSVFRPKTESLTGRDLWWFSADEKTYVGGESVMAFCKKCGAEINEQDSECPRCGAAQTPQAADNGGFLWGLLGFCIPLVGLILFLVWKDTKPRTGKAAGMGALVSVICGVVFYVLMFIIGIGAAML
jgi:hypothetical protein